MTESDTKGNSLEVKDKSLSRKDDDVTLKVNTHVRIHSLLAEDTNEETEMHKSQC